MLRHRTRWAGQIEADGQVGKWSQLEGNGIADGEGARRNGNRRLSVEGEGFTTARDNRGPFVGLRDLGGANDQRSGSE